MSILHANFMNLPTQYFVTFMYRIQYYRQISNERRTKSQNLNASRLAVAFVQSIEFRC